MVLPVGGLCGSGVFCQKRYETAAVTVRLRFKFTVWFPLHFVVSLRLKLLVDGVVVSLFAYLPIVEKVRIQPSCARR